jgi:hypothetical protein
MYRKYFEIEGYWLDDSSEFNAIVTNYDDQEEDGRFSESEIFYFGLDESDLEVMVANAEKTLEDFAVTSFIRI